jgi:hypothetical protein
MICFEVLDELVEILFEVDEEVLDFEVLKICFLECDEEDNNLKVLIWKICFEINNKQEKNQKKSQLV